MPLNHLYSIKVLVSAFNSKRATSGVAISGWPMFRWITLFPEALAALAYGISFLMGLLGIALPIDEIFGIILSFWKGKNKAISSCTSFCEAQHSSPHTHHTHNHHRSMQNQSLVLHKNPKLLHEHHTKSR